jgi:hypothetical protein
MLAAGSEVGYKAFTLLPSRYVTDKHSVKCRRCNSWKMTARVGARETAQTRPITPSTYQAGNGDLSKWGRNYGTCSREWKSDTSLRRFTRVICVYDFGSTGDCSSGRESSLRPNNNKSKHRTTAPRDEFDVARHEASKRLLSCKSGRRPRRMGVVEEHHFRHPSDRNNNAFHGL